MQETFSRSFLVWSTLLIGALTLEISYFAVLTVQPAAVSSSCSPDDGVDETSSEPALELRPDQLPRTA